MQLNGEQKMLLLDVVTWEIGSLSDYMAGYIQPYNIKPPKGYEYLRFANPTLGISLRQFFGIDNGPEGRKRALENLAEDLKKLDRLHELKERLESDILTKEYYMDVRRVIRSDCENYLGGPVVISKDSTLGYSDYEAYIEDQGLVGRFNALKGIYRQLRKAK